MAFSDEEGEIVPDSVTKYYLVDSKQNLISISSLPLRWNVDEGEEHGDGDGDGDGDGEPSESAFLRGEVEGGCGLIYSKVIAWKFDLSYVHPEIHVLLRDSNYERWIKLHKPKEGYELTIRTALISVHCLHFMKKNSEQISREGLWKHLQKTFSTFEDPPSVNDLADHLQLIKGAALRDRDIAKTKNLHAFLSQIPVKRKAAFCEDNKTRKKAKFIVDDNDDDIDDHNDFSDEDNDELFDNVCAYCDDGGDVLGCEGRCIRSFHPTIESGAPSSCESLCYTSEQVHAMDTFLCKNCKYQRHQCFICGKLGNSDKSSGAEVFPCVSATCGHFYHPECLSELLFPRDDYQSQEFQKKIKAGDSFTCPAHKCNVCKQGEDKKDPEMQFAVCRRCPKAYHSKCLPSYILFNQDDANNIPQRAWTGLLNKRILIFCRDHKITRKLLAPRRDHLLFPNDDEKSGQQSTRSKAFGTLQDEDKVEHSKGISSDILRGDPINKNRKNLPGNVSKRNLSSSATLSKNVGTPECRSLKEPSSIRNKVAQISGNRMSISSMTRIPEKAAAGSAAALRITEMKNRILKLMENSISSFNMEEFLGDQRRKCSHDSPPYFQVNKTITLGKVELSVQAIQGALQKLQEGSTVKDAKAVCEPAILTQIIKWKKKLAVYLAPFIHGVRYTSFGRHFTNVDKLKQVVNRLRWYVQDGDMIVDFSCGSNDFSCFMKEELDKMGKKCSFRNYDIIQTKNDFNFEKRDWMTVGEEELPEGSKLIIGLNPPFGVHASLANQFINKALTFKPKLLILIVPKETERLERKRTPYDLIWEEDKILSGKSFYLPGSVDVNEQQLEQWNRDAPPLYLWSRRDWTAKHKQVAMEHSHLIKNQEMQWPGGIRASAVSNYLMEENQDCYGDFSSVAAGYSDINRILEDLPETADDI